MNTLQFIKDTRFTVEDISGFILSNPSEVFDTARVWVENFKAMIARLADKNYILVFSHDGKIEGVCGWCFINEEESRKINKIRWTLPADIEDGEIFYGVFCVLRGSSSMWRLKNKLENSWGVSKCKERLWFTDGLWRRKECCYENN